MKKAERLFDFLDLQHEYYPKQDMLAAKENNEWLTYSTASVKDLVSKMARGMMKLGISGKDMTVENQDKIGLISASRPEWLILDLACQQTGAVLCPIYPTTHVNEIEFILKEAAVRYLFVSGKEVVDKIISIRNKLPELISVYCFDETESLIYWKDILANDNSLEKELEESRKKILPSHCATIIYTSGTTGLPKGVMLSHRNIVSNVHNAKSSFPFENDSKLKALSFLPLNHIFERMISYVYMASGISIYYAESMETIGENLKEVKPNLFTTVPRLLEKVYDKIVAKGSELKGVKRKLFFWALDLANHYDNQKKGTFSFRLQLALARKLIFSKWREALGNNIHFIVTGGAACQVRLIRIFTAAGIPIYEGYGPTENSPAITVNRKAKGGTKFGSVGMVLEGQEVKIEPDGEICVKGPSVMMGYYKRPELTAETIINGWLHTGDIGVFDGPYLRITDRKKELFKTSGGKYVAPQPIENRLKESPYVEQVMVVGANEKFVGALIVPSFPNLREWMMKNNISFQSEEEAIENTIVKNHYRDILNAFNLYFNPVEQVKKFELLKTEWSIESGELTPTLKIKRKVIEEKYKDKINSIYDRD
jgi:long-chain acyl-CoA synthetase